MTIVFIMYCLLNYNEADDVGSSCECWTTAIPKTVIAISLWTRVQVILSLVSVMVLIVVGPNQVIAGISWLREQLMIAEAQLAANISPREPQPTTKRLSRKIAISVITVHREVR